MADSEHCIYQNFMMMVNGKPVVDSQDTTLRTILHFQNEISIREKLPHVTYSQNSKEIDTKMRVVLSLENKIVEFSLNRVSELTGLPVLRVGSEEDYREDGQEDSETKVRTWEGRSLNTVAASSLILTSFTDFTVSWETNHKLGETMADIHWISVPYLEASLFLPSRLTEH